MADHKGPFIYYQWGLGGSILNWVAIHEINALREVFWQQVGKFPLKSIIALCYNFQHPFAMQGGFSLSK